MHEPRKHSPGMILRPLLPLALLAAQACASGNPRPAVSWDNPVQVAGALDAGADVEAPDENGWTRLLTATRAGQAEVVRVLVEHGADVQARNRDGWSALLIASRYGYPEIVTFLIDNDAYVHTRNHADYTPLMLATFGGHVEIIDILMDAGVRLDVKNEGGRTALYYAGLNGQEDVIRHLLARGAELEIFEANGEDLFATAVALKVRGLIQEEGGEAEPAMTDFAAAAGFFERAEAGLLKMADDTRATRTRGYVAGIFGSLLGLVASQADLANLREGNPTNYRALVPSAANVDLSPLEIQEEYYKALAQVASEEAEACRAKTGDGQ